MRTSLALATCAALANSVTAALQTCTANNCYRQVRASNFPTRATSADCSSFLGTTTIAPVSTATTTVTILSTPAAPLKKRSPDADPARAVLEPRAAAAGTIPAYASNCNSAAYSSACSCIGVTQGTTTATATSTVTATATAFNTVPNPFGLKITYPVSEASNPQIYVGAAPLGTRTAFKSVANVADQARFIYASDGTVASGGQTIGIEGAGDTFARFFGYTYGPVVNGQCQTSASGRFTCVYPNTGAAGVFVICRNYGRDYLPVELILVGDANPANYGTSVCADGGVPVVLTAIPYAGSSEH